MDNGIVGIAWKFMEFSDHKCDMENTFKSQLMDIIIATEGCMVCAKLNAAFDSIILALNNLSRVYLSNK